MWQHGCAYRVATRLDADLIPAQSCYPLKQQRRDLLEILEDRHGSRSTIVTSQLPLDQWHSSIGDSTLADAIMDRLVHNAYKIKLEGESLRKNKLI